MIGHSQSFGTRHYSFDNRTGKTTVRTSAGSSAGSWCAVSDVLPAVAADSSQLTVYDSQRTSVVNLVVPHEPGTVRYDAFFERFRVFEH